MRHMGSKRLETERLLLRPFSVTDAEIMFRNWASDERVTKYLTWQAYESVEQLQNTYHNLKLEI